MSRSAPRLLRPALVSLFALAGPAAVHAQAPPFRCGPDCATPGRWVLCNDTFDTGMTAAGGLRLGNFLEAACTTFTAPSTSFDVVGFAALFGPGEMVITLAQLYADTGQTAPSGSALLEAGAGVPSSGSTGFTGLFFDTQTLGADFRLCLRQQLDDPGQTIDIRALLWDADGPQGHNTQFIPGMSWSDVPSTQGDFVLRAVIDRGDMTPWQPGGSCTERPDGGVTIDAGDTTDAAMSGGDAGASTMDGGATDDAGVMKGPPAISAISPDHGSNASPVNVVVTGSGFESGAILKIGTIAADGVSVPGPTTILATVPANIAGGTYDVLVTNPGGESAILKDGYTVIDPSGASGLENKCTCARPSRSSSAALALPLLVALALVRRRAR